MISWPWDSLVLGKDEETGFPLYDRGYKAEELRAVLMRLFSNGVFDDTPSFVITPGENMSVLVSPGTCFIQGDIGYEASVREIVFTAASSQPRIDTVVLRWDNNIDARSIDLYVHQGVASATPVRPTLTRTESVWELGLADIYIPANTTSISAERITDTRLETARCGIVTPFTSIDTTTFYNQLKAQTDAAVGVSNAALTNEFGKYFGAIDLALATPIRNNTDLNDITEIGTYYFSDDDPNIDSLVNAPTLYESEGFNLYVSECDDGIWQLAIGNVSGTMAFRLYSQDLSKWLSWRSMGEGAFVSKSGDTMTGSLMIGSNDNTQWQQIAVRRNESNIAIGVNPSGSGWIGSTFSSGSEGTHILLNTGDVTIDKNFKIQNSYSDGTQVLQLINLNTSPYLSCVKDGIEKNYIQFFDDSTKLGKPLRVSSGGTGVNSIAGLESALGIAKTNMQTLTTGINYWKIGNKIVFVKCYATIGLTDSWGKKTLGTLPAGYRPQGTYVEAPVCAEDCPNSCVTLIVETSGEVSFKAHGATAPGSNHGYTLMAFYAA